MSISSFTTVLMLDCRNAPMTIAVPKSTDILNRVITFKDLYGSSITNNITLSTYNGDIFENGLNTLVISNSFQSVNLYAGLPGKWLNVGGSAATASGGGGGIATIPSFISALTLSTNLLTAVTISNTGTISTNIIGAGSAWITALNAGATTTVGLSNTGTICNSAALSNYGTGYFGQSLTVNTGGLTVTAGGTTLQGFSNTGIICNSLALSNYGTGYFASNLTADKNIQAGDLTVTTAGISVTGGGLTVSAGGTTTVGFSNTGAICNSLALSNYGTGYFASNLTVAAGGITQVSKCYGGHARW